MIKEKSDELQYISTIVDCTAFNNLLDQLFTYVQLVDHENWLCETTILKWICMLNLDMDIDDELDIYGKWDLEDKDVIKETVLDLQYEINKIIKEFNQKTNKQMRMDYDSYDGEAFFYVPNDNGKHYYEYGNFYYSLPHE